MEPERGEQDVVRDAVVESSSRIDHLTEHPGSGTAASDQLDVAAIGSPVVPKMFQGADEVGRMGVEPGKLVEEDDLGAFGLLFQSFLKKPKGLGPIGSIRLYAKLVAESKAETGKLLLGCHMVFARDAECESVFEQFFYQKSFADTSPAVDGYKLGSTARNIAFKLLYLCLSAYNILLHIYLFLAKPVAKLQNTRDCDNFRA